jgi:hypothetical protein
MALSPNYNWSEPDNSSLVKDGALAMRTLGDAIDTSLWNVGYGQAGKNKIINGDFGVNQRNFTSTTIDGTFGFDRFRIQTGGDGTCTYSAQTFTPGAAPVAGYEGKNYARIVTTGQTTAGSYSALGYNIEDVRTFAGQTATLSFWAKAASGTPKIYAEFAQDFGTGGSPSSDVIIAGSSVTLSTSWARYSITIAIPSISGKTIGTTANSSYVITNFWVSAGSTFNSRTGSLGIQSNTFELWGVQAEYGSKATPFQTATGTIQGELAACQRYYWRRTASTGYDNLATGVSTSATASWYSFTFPVEMRTAPSAYEFSGLQIAVPGNTAYNVTALAFDGKNAKGTGIGATTASGGLGSATSNVLYGQTSGTSYLAFTAEL